MNIELPITEHSLSAWYANLREGDNRAIELLWNFFFEKMVRVARRKMDGSKRAARDEEDIAASAFKSFCNGLRNDRFQAADSATKLWPLLASLTINKAIDYIRAENRQKRGGTGNVLSNKAFTDARAILEELVAAEPTAEMQAVATESFNSLLEALDATGDSDLRLVTILCVEGNSSSDIASQLGCNIRTVQRKIKTIRAIWESTIR
jgi:RNA polymerase sigma factor (sigma-70 family)